MSMRSGYFYSKPNPHAIGNATIKVNKKSANKVKIGNPININSNPYNGCLKAKRSARASILCEI